MNRMNEPFRIRITIGPWFRRCAYAALMAAVAVFALEGFPWERLPGGPSLGRAGASGALFLVFLGQLALFGWAFRRRDRWRGGSLVLAILAGTVMDMGLSWEISRFLAHGGALQGSARFMDLSLYLLFAAGFLEGVEALTRSRRLLHSARSEALQAKLAPHFIFNALNTLHAQIEADPRAAQAMTERLGSLFQQVLEASWRPTVALREELAFVEAYLGIERVRLGARLSVHFEVPEELEDDQIPPLSLQVLVENAVKHGIAPSESGGEIRISAKREGRDTVVAVSDTGTGVSSLPGTGTALETLRARLAAPGDLSLARAGGRTVASFRWRQG